MQSRIIKIGASTKTNITALQQTAIIPTITTAEAKAGVDNNIVELVDIRTDQERDEYNIGGLHFELDELEDNLDEFKPGKTYVFYCSSGKRSGEAVKLLQQQLPGIKAYSLEGGLGSW